MIKVLSVVIDNHIGGIQNRILSVGSALRRQGIQTIVLSPQGEGNFSNVARNSAFITHQASIESPLLFNSVKNVVKNIFWIIKFPLGVAQTSKIIKKESIDIVHVNGLLSLHAVLAAKLTGTPLVWHLIGTIYPQRLVRVVRPIFQWSKICILVTNKTKNYYFGNDFDARVVKVIYEPVDISRFQKMDGFNKNNIKDKYCIPRDSFVIGFVGNISPVKNLIKFLEVAKYQSNHSKEHTYFVIAGTIPKNHYDYFKYLLDYIIINNLSERVKIINEFEDVRDIYNIIDIFMMTSSSEGTPLVILEAMAMQLPVIAPDVGGISEQISHGVTGFLYPTGDIFEAINNLEKMMSNSSMREEMGKFGRERVISSFSLERCIESHNTLYKEVIKHGRS